MSGDATDDSWKFEAEAAALLERLREVYRVYNEKCKERDRPNKGFLRLFKGWFSGVNPLTAEPVHQEFLDSVEDIITRLDSALSKLSKYEDKSSGYALEVTDILLAPKPAFEKTTAEWYMTIAEYSCAPILPYLKREDLRRIRDAQLESTPKRMMYPKQRELFEYMEKLLSSRK